MVGINSGSRTHRRLNLLRSVSSQDIQLSSSHLVSIQDPHPSKFISFVSS